MSSERSRRLRSPSAHRRSKLRSSHTPSPSPRRGSPTSDKPRKLPIPSEPIEILPKCSSEPLLPGTSGDGSPTSGDWFHRQMTCTDLFSPDRLLSPHEGYQKDTKVVVTVTVEGSPGPIRTMAKLGSSVDEIIKLVIEKYGREGRTPKLDRNSASTYELHLSYFSLEGLDGSDVIGDIGSRSFFLRKGASKPTALDSDRDLYQPGSSIVFLPGRYARKIAKVVRRIRRLWKVFCLH